MKDCFIVCPIGDTGTAIRKRSDQVFRHIVEPVCKNKDFTPTRSDKIHGVDKIDQTIIEKLNSADLVIADLSEHNANAFFELGYRTALHKPLIHIAEAGQDLPFDVSGIRTIFYDLHDPDKIDECKARLSETIDAICISSENPAIETQLASNPSGFRPHIAAQILTNLLEIKDMISDLKNASKDENTKLVEQVIAAFTNQIHTTATPQDRAMEWFVKEFFKNPQKMSAGLSQLSKMDLPIRP